MEVTCDFRRYYQLTVPNDLHGLKARTVYDLLVGLLLIQGSLYAGWVLQHVPASGEPPEKQRISAYAWTTQVSLLTDIRNLLRGFMSENKESVEKDMVYPPEIKENIENTEASEIPDATIETMRALMNHM